MLRGAFCGQPRKLWRISVPVPLRISSTFMPTAVCPVAAARTKLARPSQLISPASSMVTVIAFDGSCTSVRVTVSMVKSVFPCSEGSTSRESSASSFVLPERSANCVKVTAPPLRNSTERPFALSSREKAPFATVAALFPSKISTGRSTQRYSSRSVTVCPLKSALYTTLHLPAASAVNCLPVNTPPSGAVMRTSACFCSPP